MSLKNRRTKIKKRRNSQIDRNAVEILRTVGDQEAFYFYEAIEKPTGDVARSLLDFLGKVKSAKSESLIFHLQRGDFQNWVKGTLGDSKLARELGRISFSSGDDARTEICKSVENHVRKLRGLSLETVIAENPTVVLP